MFKSIIAILVALPVAAFAAGTSGSEFFYQTDAGKSNLTPSFNYMTVEYEDASMPASAEVTGTQLALEYEYGLMAELSLGAKLSYSNMKSEMSTFSATAKGLNDVDLFVKATMPAGPGALKYGATLSLSPGDAVDEANGDSNGYSGGHSLTPYVGYEMSMEPCLFGAKLAVEVGLTDRTTEDKSTSPSTSSDASGGEETTLSLFYEHKFNEDMRIGASLDWATAADDKDETTGSTSENTSPAQTLTVYLPTTLGGGVLLPSLSYLFTTDDKIDGVELKTYSGTMLEVGYRLTF